MTALLGEAVVLQLDDVELMRSAQSALWSALEGLNGRARTVIERTALQGESCRSSARTLGISERQLHRDRAAAIAHVARRIPTTPNAGTMAQPVIVTNILDLQWSRAIAQEELGLFDASQTLLCEIREASNDTERARALAYLSGQSLQRGRITEASRFASEARATALSTGNAVAHSTATIAEARIRVAAGQVEAGESTLRRSVVELRALMADGHQTAAAEPLVNALVSQWEVFRLLGRPRDAHSAASEAVENAGRLGRPTPGLALSAGAALAESEMFLRNDAAGSLERVGASYSTAVASGSIRRSIYFAALLATVEHSIGKFQESAERLGTLLSLVRDFPACATKSYFLMMLAQALEGAGRSSEALQILVEATQQTSAEQRRMHGYLSLARAMARLRSGDAFAALEDADEAARLLAATVDVSVLGACAQTRARALIALRRYSEALSAAEEAYALLTAANHPTANTDARTLVSRLRRTARRRSA